MMKRIELYFAEPSTARASLHSHIMLSQRMVLAICTYHTISVGPFLEL